MSRIGRKPIPVPEAVTVEVAPGRVAVKGPKGELTQSLSPEMKVEQDDGAVTVQRPTDRGEHRALHGLTRSLIANMVEGVTEGFEKRLEIQGVGYRAQLKGRKLEMALGYSHPVSIEPPQGIEF
jgi:large subunit ribosomal protein L6